MKDASTLAAIAEQTAEKVAAALKDEETVGSDGQQRRFTITKFGRHEDGYFHARVTVNEVTIYVHRKFGSWMAPGTVNGKAMMKDVTSMAIKEVLQKKAREIEKRERKENGQPDDTDNEGSEGGSVQSPA